MRKLHPTPLVVSGGIDQARSFLTTVCQGNSNTVRLGAGQDKTAWDSEAVSLLALKSFELGADLVELGIDCIAVLGGFCAPMVTGKLVLLVE